MASVVVKFESATDFVIEYPKLSTSDLCSSEIWKFHQFCSWMPKIVYNLLKHYTLGHGRPLESLLLLGIPFQTKQFCCVFIWFRKLQFDLPSIITNKVRRLPKSP